MPSGRSSARRASRRSHPDEFDEDDDDDDFGEDDYDDDCGDEEGEGSGAGGKHMACFDQVSQWLHRMQHPAACSMNLLHLLQRINWTLRSVSSI